jgi:hypothetical protein
MKTNTKPTVMNTIETIRNLKRIAVTGCAALAISTGCYSQPNADKFPNVEQNAFARLEQLMVATEQNARFVSPAVQDNMPAIANCQNQPADCGQEPCNHEKPVFFVENSQERNYISATQCKHNPGLIQVGYYQQVKPVFWQKLKGKIFSKYAVPKNKGFKVITTSYIVNFKCKARAL